MNGIDHSGVPTAWLIRAGQDGEREDHALETGLAFGGWDGLPDLSGVSNRDDMQTVVRRMLPGNSKMSVANYVGQLWALRSRVRAGDLAVLPRKRTRQIALGHVTQGYEYRDDPDPEMRHVVAVNWKRVDVPWDAIGEDLRHSLSTPRTICSIRCDDVLRRLEGLMVDGRDPGGGLAAPSAVGSSRMTQLELHSVLVDALDDQVVAASNLGAKPLELELREPLPSRVRAYVYNATRPPGGRPAGEHKVQLIVPGQARGERGNFDISGDHTVLLVGYAAEESVFVLWDAGAYRDFGYSRNVQIKSRTLLNAFAGEIGLQKRTLRPRRGVTIRETVVAATAGRLDEAIELRVDFSLKRLLDEFD